MQYDVARNWYRMQDHPVLNRDNIALAAVVEVNFDADESVSDRFVVANTHLLCHLTVRMQSLK